MEEIWKDIPNYEGFYQASNLGNIKSLNRETIMETKNQHCKFKCKKIIKEKILKPKLTKDGYYELTLRKDGKQKFIRDVDRTNASQKYVSLVKFADYCLFEMVVNRHLISDSEIKNRLANVNYFLIELINYIVIFINNCFVIYHFYKSPYLPIENYDIFDEKEKDILHFDNIIISIAQAAILSFFLIIWILFEFFNDIQFNIFPRQR